MPKNDDRVTEWEEGLPSPEELTPLSQSLISPELASAFSINSEPARTISDVHRASVSAFATLRRTASVPIPGFNELQSPGSAEDERGPGAAFVFGIDGQAGENGVGGGGEAGNISSVAGTAGLDQNISPFPQPFQAQGIPAAGFPPATGQLGSSPAVLNGLPPYAVSSYERKPDGSPSAGAGFGGTDSSDGAVRRFKNQNEGEAEEADTGAAPENSNDEQAARTLKRPRLVWTPQLHKRFVDAVAHLGIKNAVPKTIMQLMNVEGLTRENVASHLQKYRLYLKRMQGFSNEGPTASDQLFASTPVPPSLAASAHFLAAHRDDGMLMPFTAPVVPVPLPGFGHGHIPGHVNSAVPFAGFDPHAYNAVTRTTPQRMVSGDQRELLGDNQSQPGSPPRHILTLFPSSSR